MEARGNPTVRLRLSGPRTMKREKKIRTTRSNRSRRSGSPLDRTANALTNKILFYLLQPDLTVAHEFSEMYFKKSFPQAEKMLMFAVLSEAIQCLDGRGFSPKRGAAGKRKQEGLSHEAEAWMLEEDDDSPFSFDNVCRVLGLDTEGARKQLLCQKRRIRLCG